jgi:hypothetical protein
MNKGNNGMQIIFLLIISLYTGFACAAEKVDIVCLKAQEDSSKCEKFDIRVSIETGKDAGLRGGYGVVSISRETNQAAFWTEMEGWSAYNEEYLLRATNPGLKKLEPRKEFVIFSGTEQQLCKLSNQKSFDIYTWHHGFDEASFTKTRKFTERFEIRGQYLENFWNSIMVYKSVAEKKTTLVYSKECSKGS